MSKKLKKQETNESFSNRDSNMSSSNCDSRAFPSFIYQNPSFSINSFQSISDRNLSKPIKKTKKSLNTQNGSDMPRKEKEGMRSSKQLNGNIEGQDINKKSSSSSSTTPNSNKLSVSCKNNNNNNCNNFLLPPHTIPDSSKVTVHNNNFSSQPTSKHLNCNSDQLQINNQNKNQNQSCSQINALTNPHISQIPSTIECEEFISQQNSFIDNAHTTSDDDTKSPFHFSFEKSKMIGRTNSSYVYSLYDKENRNLNRALKIQLHPKMRHHPNHQINQSNQFDHQNPNHHHLSHPQQQSQQPSSNQQRCMCSMLKDEWEVLKSMNHPHVINGYKLYEDLEIEPNSYCCAIEMELAECNLHQLLVKVSQQQQFCLKFVKRILFEVTSALNYFHNNVNFTHNDIKADNIFIFFDHNTNQYFAKLADLGTARTYTQENHYTASLFKNWKCRNPEYQPPEIITFLNEAKNKESLEQLNSIHGFDEKKADIFNLGSLFFAVLFQLRPYSCRGATENDPLYKLIFENRYQEFWSQDKFQRMLGYWASYQKEQDMVNMIQLITSMIQQDASLRPSVDQILSHPWFSEDEAFQFAH